MSKKQNKENKQSHTYIQYVIKKIENLGGCAWLRGGCAWPLRRALRGGCAGVAHGFAHRPCVDPCAGRMQGNPYENRVFDTPGDL